jgi:cytochrome b
MFWLDATLLVSISALQTVRFTGLVLHEWLGLAMVGMVLAHLLFSWSWIASQSRRFTLQSIRARINYFLNLSLFAAVTAVDLLRRSDITEGGQHETRA